MRFLLIWFFFFDHILGFSQSEIPLCDGRIQNSRPTMVNEVIEESDVGGTLARTEKLYSCDYLLGGR